MEDEKVIPEEGVLGVCQMENKTRVCFVTRVTVPAEHEQVYGFEKRAENGQRSSLRITIIYLGFLVGARSREKNSRRCIYRTRERRDARVRARIYTSFELFNRFTTVRIRSTHQQLGLIISTSTHFHFTPATLLKQE